MATNHATNASTQELKARARRAEQPRLRGYLFLAAIGLGTAASAWSPRTEVPEPWQQSAGPWLALIAIALLLSSVLAGWLSDREQNRRHSNPQRPEAMDELQWATLTPKAQRAIACAIEDHDDEVVRLILEDTRRRQRNTKRHAVPA